MVNQIENQNFVGDCIPPPYKVEAFISRPPYEAYDHRIFRRRLDMGITITQLRKIAKINKEFTRLEQYVFLIGRPYAPRATVWKVACFGHML